jgi:hypothetical protein
MQECNVGDCAVRRPPDEMIPVRGEIDGQPIVGQACSPNHAQALVLQWATGDRYSAPDEIFRTVGDGLTESGVAA